MRRIRTIVMGVALAAMAVLAVLSVVGAVLGAERARAMFNSAPLVVYWVGLALLLAAGFGVYPRLVKRPAGLVMHLGALLILVGGMWGSDLAHALRRDLLGAEKVSRGFMAIHEGTRERRVYRPVARQDGPADEAPGETQKAYEVVAELPFEVALRDFRMDYYEMPGRRWHLVVAAPVYGADGRLLDRRQAEIPWEVGRAVPVPFTRAEVTVLEYLPRARPTYAEDAEPVVEIEDAAGRVHRLPARRGAEVALEEPPVTVRAERVFTCLKVRPTDEGMVPYEAEGEGINPAVELALIHPDGTRERRFALALAPQHGRREGDPAFRYVFPRPSGAEPDPDASVPAMRVRVARGEREMTRWLLPGRDEPYASLDLAPLFPGPAAPAESERGKGPEQGKGTEKEPAKAQDQGQEDGEGKAEPTPAEGRPTPDLFLVRPDRPVRDYYSDLVVLDDGRTVAEKTIEVNHPLHWGGYHFYQSDYDHEAHRYTVLQVKSDSGLWLVWVGMVLLVAGTFWRFWGEAILAKIQRELAASTSER